MSGNLQSPIGSVVHVLERGTALCNRLFPSEWANPDDRWVPRTRLQLATCEACKAVVAK